MKKLLVLMLTVVMILSFGIIASATEAENTIVTTETELLDALANGGNITLGADIQLTDGWTVDAEKEVVLDLAGNDLTVGQLTSNASIRGKLTVKDTVGGGVSTARNHFVYGELILESGTLQNISTNTAGFAVNIDTTGKATISGGSVKAVNTANYAIRVLGNLIVDGGEHSGNHGVISVEGGTATINNGIFTCLGVASQTDNVVYVASGSITINNGTFIADSDSAASGTCVCDSAGTAVIENGTFSNSSGGDVWGVTGGTVIKGGTFENLVETAHVATGATITNKGETVIKNEDGTLTPALAYVAEVNGVKFETVADALAYAKEQGITDLVITLIGATTKESAIALEDTFYLYAQEAFDSVTFKQADNSVPYYISGIYTGERTNNGTFVFDGVNIIVTDQYIFEGNVKLINNSIVKSISDANCFHYYSTTIVEAGSMLAGVIDDFRGGDLIIDGGLTDGSFSVAPSLQDAILNINWAGSSLTIKNGAYAKVNAANEVGRVTINAGADLNVYSSKLETVEYITNDGTINVDINSIIKTGKITGAGVINVDITGLTGSALVIDADMSEFTGTINIVGTGAVSYEITEDGLVVKVAEYVAEIDGVKYATLDEAVEALKANGGTIKLLSDIGGSMTFNDKNGEFATKNPITVDLNGFTITSAESTLWVSDGYVVTIMDSSEAKTGKITTTTNDEVVGIARNGKVIFESGTVEGIAFGVYIYDTNDTDKEVFVMNGGTITVPNGGIAFGISSGKAIINGGEVLCNKYQGGSGWCSVVYDVTATLTITGGKFLGTIGNWGIIAISGGTFSYCGDVNDGFNNEHLAAGYTTQTNDDGSITVVKLPSAAKIGDVEYSTIEEALRAVKNGETIVLIANCTMAEVVELRNIAITIEGEYTLTLNDKLKVFGETTLNIKSAIVGEVWLDNGTILKDSYINGSVFVAGNVTFRGENSVEMLYDFGVLESNYGTSAPMAWTVEKGASLEIRAKARYGLGYGDSVTIFGSIEDALTARESLTEGDVAFFAHGLVAQESASWNKDNYFTVQDAYVVIGSNNSFGNKPGNYGGNYSFIFNNTVLDASRITFYEAISKTELSFTNCDVVTGTFMTRDADSAFILTNTKLLSTTTSNGTDEGNYNEGVITLINSILTYSAQLTNNGTIKLDANSCLTAPSIVGTGKFIIDATGLMADKLVIDADLSGFTGTIEVIGAASYEITEDGVVVKVAKYVAEINGVKYTSLEDAFKAAADGDTIKLNADIDVNETIVIPEGLEITIDLNGKKLTAANDNVNLDINGDLTIIDSIGGGVSTMRNHKVYGSLTVESGTLQNIATLGAGYPVNLYGGKVIVNGGTIQAVNNANYAINLSNDIGDVTINAGTVKGNFGCLYVSTAGSKVVVNGGTFEVTGGIGGHCVYSTNGNITISNGTFIPFVSDNKTTSYSVYVNGEAANVVITGGTFGNDLYERASVAGNAGTITVSGGTFESPVAKEYCAYGYKNVETDAGTYNVSVWTVNTNDIFTYLGVSAKMDGTGITVGYEFDKDAYALYCEQNEVTLEFGTHFAVAGYAPVEKSMVEYAGVAGQFNVIVTGLSDAHAELKLEMALYIVEGESKQYVTANGIEEAVSVTYDAIPASYKKEEVVA